MFLQLKRIKPMRGTPLHKLSEIGYAAVDLSSERFTPGEQRLTMYKKPVDFTRDPAKMKVAGCYMDVKISLRNEGGASSVARFSAA
mmetsp:Transcript_2544/g.4781  ORF Transcript_2544/g.4781 Transcript_2544/m.4781 type:complete len:86 (+) Transcript_2544:654-911(+)